MEISVTAYRPHWYEYLALRNYELREPLSRLAAFAALTFSFWCWLGVFAWGFGWWNRIGFIWPWEYGPALELWTVAETMALLILIYHQRYGDVE